MGTVVSLREESRSATGTTPRLSGHPEVAHLTPDPIRGLYPNKPWVLWGTDGVRVESGEV